VSLSVLSALARLDVDPWQEAGELTRLPRDAAIALPDGLPVHLDPGTISGRLIALLPSHTRFNTHSHQTLPDLGQEPNSRAVSYAIIVIISLMLGAQCIMASRQPPAQVDDTHTPAFSTLLPQMPPPNSGQ
jgi:hypothetical protein